MKVWRYGLVDSEDFESERDQDDFLPEDEDQMEALIESLAELLPKSDVMMLDPRRVNDLRVAYDLIQTAIKTDSEVTMVCRQSDVARDMAYIGVEGASVKFMDTVAFANIAGLASATEVYPLAQDKVRLTFAFNELMIPLG